ncbi:hypothetical protein ABW21_db0200810 [Orbilia brochopaga]|nr:hypothetical protein ABW21_db0200810 [Drechslerella brochopaga]
MTMDDHVDTVVRPAVQPQPIIMCSQPTSRGPQLSTPVQYVMPGFPTEEINIVSSPRGSEMQALCPYPLDLPRSVPASVSEPPSDDDEEASYGYVALCKSGPSTVDCSSKGEPTARQTPAAEPLPKRTPRTKPDYLLQFDQRREMQLKFTSSQISAFLQHLEEQLEHNARETFDAIDERQEQLEKEVERLKQEIARLETANADLAENLEVVTAERDHYREVVLSPKRRGVVRS